MLFHESFVIHFGGESHGGEMADLQGIACVVCGSETFEETDDGFYVCRRCGTQSQDVRKEVHDEDAALNMGLVGRGARSRRVRDPERVRLGADGRVVQRPGDGPPPKTARRSRRRGARRATPSPRASAPTKRASVTS